MKTELFKLNLQSRNLSDEDEDEADVIDTPDVLEEGEDDADGSTGNEKPEHEAEEGPAALEE